MYDLTENQKKAIVKTVLTLNEHSKLLNEGMTKREIVDEMNCLLKLLMDSDSFLSDLLQLLIKTENLCPNPETGELV